MKLLLVVLKLYWLMLNLSNSNQILGQPFPNSSTEQQLSEEEHSNSSKVEETSSEWASSTLINLFNPSQAINFTAQDGIILVDFWAKRICPESNDRVDHIAVRLERFLQNHVRSVKDDSLRPRVLYALSGTEQTSYVLKDPKLRSRYWFGQDSKADTTLVRKAENLLISGQQIPSPLTLFPAAGEGCNGSTNFTSPDVRLHPAITIDYERDIMFDDRFVFERMSKLGLKRLFYVGSALNLCVFHKRRFSALEALLSKRFESVGIILEFTMHTWGIPSVQCERQQLDESQCAYSFADWVANDLRIPPKFTRNKIRFWKTASK